MFYKFTLDQPGALRPERHRARTWRSKSTRTWTGRSTRTSRSASSARSPIPARPRSRRSTARKNFTYGMVLPRLQLLTMEKPMQTLGVHSEVGTLRTVLVCRPGPGASAVDAREPGRPAVRRRAVGARSAEGPLRLRAEDARARTSKCSSCTICSPKPWPTRRRGDGSSIGASRRTTSARASRRSCARGSTRCRRRSSPST